MTSIGNKQSPYFGCSWSKLTSEYEESIEPTMILWLLRYSNAKKKKKQSLSKEISMCYNYKLSQVA